MAKTFSINTYTNVEGELSKSTQLTVVDGETTTVIGIAGKAMYDNEQRNVLINYIEDKTSSTLTEDEKASLETTINSYTFLDSLI